MRGFPLRRKGMECFLNKQKCIRVSYWAGHVAGFLHKNSIFAVKAKFYI